VKVSFVIPAYNEEKTVGEVVESLKREFPSAEIIVVDDGSSDKTFEVAVEAGADKVIRHENNQGLGGAVSTGIRNAAGDFCVIVDADGQHSVAEVKKVVNSLDSTVDAVFTQRTSLNTSGWFRALGKWILVHTVNFFARGNFSDINSGLQAVKRKKIVNYLDILPRRYSFSTALILVAHLLKFRVKFVTISPEPRRAGRSKVKLKDFLRALFIILSTVVIFEPLYFFIPLAVYSFYAGVIGGFLSLFLSEKLNPFGFTRFFEFSVLMFIMGLVSHQMSVVIRRLLDSRGNA